MNVDMGSMVGCPYCGELAGGSIALCLTNLLIFRLNCLRTLANGVILWSVFVPADAVDMCIPLARRCRSCKRIYVDGMDPWIMERCWQCASRLIKPSPLTHCARCAYPVASKQLLRAYGLITPEPPASRDRTANR